MRAAVNLFAVDRYREFWHPALRAPTPRLTRGPLLLKADLMLVPFGSMTGFSLPAEIRTIAGYYGVRSKSLRAVRGRCGERMTMARHALFWQLTAVRGLTPGRAAALLHAPVETVRQGSNAHSQRIAEFLATVGQPLTQPDEA